MDERKAARFDCAAELLICPVCGEALRRDGITLTCARGHRFDIARQGYVNLLRGGKPRATGGAEAHLYDRASFERRRRVFEQGLYDPVIDALCATLSKHVPAAPTPLVLDAGCGEGYVAERVRAVTGARVAAFDISKDSVQLAAAANPSDGIVWFVADLATMPVGDARVDCALNVFSPANYQAFRRVLKPHGVVIKVVPTEHHLQELRERAGSLLKHERYSNQRVLDHFVDRCTLIEQWRVTGTSELDPETRAALVAMTPLLSAVDVGAINWNGLDHATVEADILVGTFA